MTTNKDLEPRHYDGVMVSSTFSDLEHHRAALIKAVTNQGFKVVAMEDDAAKVVDVIDSSLQMVRDARAYIGIISRKYGQTPVCPKRNPGKLSLTELEFNEAQELGRPILLFLMGDKHPVCEADVETNATKRKKLNAFRERAKQMKPESQVHRVYATFNSLEEFTAKAIQSVADLRRYLDELAGNAQEDDPTPAPRESLPRPPELYAEPRYIASHAFVGRQAQLDVLEDWAEASDPHPVLLFDAIGGTGKSMLTWEWTTKHAVRTRTDWAGRFWYSFYERGAVMADFCQRALAYMTGRPLEEFCKKKTKELATMMLHCLQERPWLVVLDGLERVLIAYHRIDAAEVRDEDANQPTDKVANRDPCAAIRPEDDDLLRALAAAAPSKLLLTSRLAPRVLLNPSSQPIQGVLRVSLPGLRPADAEALVRACGVTGDSQAIQTYLKSHCDCHPLVCGVLAGLVMNYFPDKGNFDAWAADAAGGGMLNLANLGLNEKRNNILRAGLEALPEKSRQLLSTLALLSGAVDYSILIALNPLLPPEPEEVEEPPNPEDTPWWGTESADEKQSARLQYEITLQRRRSYELAVQARLHSPEYRTAKEQLGGLISDLEHRGLLQYDHQSKRYDLHPVVRGITAGCLPQEDKERFGQRMVDYFSQQAPISYENAETIEDVSIGVHLVRVLLQMGRFQQAADAYLGILCRPLMRNLEAYAEALSIERPFFRQGWNKLPDCVDERSAIHLANDASIALLETGQAEEALAVEGAVIANRLELQDWETLASSIVGVANVLSSRNQTARLESFALLALDLASLSNDLDELFRRQLDRFQLLTHFGRFDEADALWKTLESMPRPSRPAAYRLGAAEIRYAEFQFYRGTFNEEHLFAAERLAKKGRDRGTIRRCYVLRGEWHMASGEWELAAESFDSVVRMDREVGRPRADNEVRLALAKLHLEKTSEARSEAERVSGGSHPPHLELADLWLALGDDDQAKKHALEAYKWAWADGEPYVHRYALNRSASLLKEMHTEVPNLPLYDPEKDKKFPWEDELVAAVTNVKISKKADTQDGNFPDLGR
jgi:hypothetical protein